MAKLVNLARMTTATAGTGTITLGSAVSGYLTFALAGTLNGDVVYYAIKDGANSEIGIGTYTTSGTTLSRDTVLNSTNAGSKISLSGTAEVFITPPATAWREVLTANRTYFVLTTGSDSNNGLANTAGGAFLTITKALSTVAALDLSIYSVNIQVGAGTYTSAVSVTAPWVGSGTVALLGDTTTPANVAITVTGASAISLTNNATLTLGGFTLSTITAGELANLGSGSQLTLTGAMGFGACPSTNGKILLASGARFNSVGVNAAISGSTAIFLNSSNASAIIFGGTWTTSGTPAFSNAFVYAQNAAYVQWSGTTFAGTGATGSRYASVAGAVINTFGSGTTYFPGNTAGTGTNPGASPYGFYG